MIRFAQAKNEDLPGIINVMKNTGYVAYSYKGKSDEEIEKDLVESGHIILICFEKIFFSAKKIIGYFLITTIGNHLVEAQKHTTINNHYAYHLGIGIHSDYRGKGLAKKLTAFALFKAQQEGYKGMYAEVSSDNTVSLHLQESSGFEKVCEFSSKKRKQGIKNILFVKHFPKTSTNSYT